MLLCSTPAGSPAAGSCCAELLSAAAAAPLSPYAEIAGTSVSVPLREPPNLAGSSAATELPPLPFKPAGTPVDAGVCFAEVLVALEASDATASDATGLCCATLLEAGGVRKSTALVALEPGMAAVDCPALGICTLWCLILVGGVSGLPVVTADSLLGPGPAGTAAGAVARAEGPLCC